MQKSIIGLVCLAVILFFSGIFLSCAEEKKQPEHLVTISGYVRSVWLWQYAEEAHPVVAFETEDGRLETVVFERIEPRLWQGMHVRLVYKKAPETYHRLGCPYYHSAVLVVSIERLDLPTKSQDGVCGVKEGK